MGDARVRLGEFGAAADAFRAGRVLVRGDALAEARLLLKVSQMSWQQGRRPEALRWIRRADGLLEARRDLPARAERARLAVEYGAVRQQQGRASEAIRWWRRAIPEAEAAGARDALAHAYYLLDWALQSLGRGEEAVNAPAALVIYEELGDLGQQAKVLNNLGAKAYFEGAWDEAIAYYERARIAFERLGAQVDAATPILNIGEILSDQGQLPEAEAQLRQALRVCRAADYRSGAAQASALLGVVEARAGRFEEGLVLLADARALYLADGEKVAAIEVDAKVVECLVLRGDGRAASTLAADTLERALAADAGYLEPALRRLSGQALALIGRSDMARQALDEALATARRAGDEYQTALILEALRRLPAPARAGLDARAMADEHHRILAKLGVRATGSAPL
jgi:tetratricopeptide (TPR) repeat protein